MNPKDWKLIYVAGPFRADTPWGVMQNVRHAEAWTLRMNELAYAAELPVSIVCPHTQTQNFDKLLDDRWWLNSTKALLARCDALIAIPGWDRSRGTQDEIDFMVKHCHKPVSRIAEHVKLDDVANGEWLQRRFALICGMRLAVDPETGELRAVAE